jgi:hypothetical protein
VEEQKNEARTNYRDSRDIIDIEDPLAWYLALLESHWKVVTASCSSSRLLLSMNHPPERIYSNYSGTSSQA